jgi:hypothetical protein
MSSAAPTAVMPPEAIAETTSEPMEVKTEMTSRKSDSESKAL